MIREIKCKQRSSEWLEAKCGRVSASGIADALDFTRKGGESQARKHYKAKIVAEILTGRVQQSFVSDPMLWGMDNEPLARAAYEVHFDREVTEAGFFVHPTIERAGASPDGLIGPTGLLEIKCPNTTTQLDYWLADVVPECYKPQMLWQMACTDSGWCDFASYDPRLPEHLQLFVKRFNRDDAKIAEMEKAVNQFLLEVDTILAQLPQPDGSRSMAPIIEASLGELGITAADCAL